MKTLRWCSGNSKPVIAIELDLEAAEWIEQYLPLYDTSTKELQAAIAELEQSE